MSTVCIRSPRVYTHVYTTCVGLLCSLMFREAGRTILCSPRRQRTHLQWEYDYARRHQLDRLTRELVESLGAHVVRVTLNLQNEGWGTHQALCDVRVDVRHCVVTKMIPVTVDKLRVDMQSRSPHPSCQRRAFSLARPLAAL